MAYAWIHLARDKSILVIARFKSGHIFLGAPLDDLLVGFPKDHLGVRTAILFNQIVNPLGPVIRVILDGLVRERRIGCYAPKDIVLRLVSLVI